MVPALLTSVDWSNPFHYLRRKSLYVLQYHLYKRFSQFYKMPFASHDVLDRLPDLGELLREMFDPVDADQYKDDALEELKEFVEMYSMMESCLPWGVCWLLRRLWSLCI